MSTLWSAGRYEAVGHRIAHIAEEVLDTVERRGALPGAAVVDLACGTGSAALSAAGRGAHVTAVDITPELLEIGAGRDPAAAVTWRCGDAADTGLPAGSFDAAVSNMGIIFVDPQRQVRELARLLKPSATLAFSSWVRDAENPLFDPVVAVLGPPASSGFTPDQWGDDDIVTERLTPDFEDLDWQHGEHRWEFESLPAAMHWLREESPIHVETFRRADAARQQQLSSAFESALRPHTDSSGRVSFASSYVVVSAARRQ
ncbi:methylase involved in ubiquinone/menaquinone biosynthesis [Mycolicibacterium chubuense NBB4]|uniref:Methylase involved in ubiquinone/menaquinone biosynthesis n=1 Tax=Mycolicibacterium chubuense (strain NBB4) TaxID=710421 RepID=I4BFY1_MYCCN|nr:class I SAM-dependent methyltransferase [Mycolicibacterium chubuense]AFM16188.1 methylase involved in ubiquinone/menaquinone biosynthesis [Mycolicibacterium chubuense NBB4]